MENVKQQCELRRLISKAREACAGSNVKSFRDVNILIGKAYGFAYQVRCYEIAKQLLEISNLVSQAKNYGDRLEPDRRLCDILNGIDKELK